MRTGHRAALAAAVLALAGCGSDDNASAPPTAATPAASLDEDALLAVHDEFVVCTQKDDSFGITVNYRDGQVAAAGEGAGGGEYNEKLSAPRTIGELVDTGTAQYVGLRANTRKGQSGGTDLDVLIFPSATEAEAQAAPLSEESGTQPEQTELFLVVPLERGARVPTGVGDCVQAALP